jgi:hypothetical protein
LLTSQFDDLFEFRRQQALLGSSSYSDASTTTDFYESLVTKDAQRAQHRVRIHTKFRGEVPRLRNLFARTSFALNLCTPYCAASPISYFPHSSVTLSAPVKTRHGRLFSKLVVRYIHRGKATSFIFSWAGDPSF